MVEARMGSAVDMCKALEEDRLASSTLATFLEKVFEKNAVGAEKEQ
jgi:hypothetical protein